MSFTVEEVQAATTHLKTDRKAPGVNGIDADLLKVDPELAAGYLCTLFEHIRENVKVQDDWKKGMIA